MSSHGGQQNFPFGYEQENIHGIGLPEFITPGPPPGQPLLNAVENHNLDQFFNDFDQNAASKQFGNAQFVPTAHNQYFTMPPTFVGSETDLGNHPVIDPNHLQGGFQYGDGMLDPLGQQHALDNMHGQAYNQTGFHNTLIDQLQTAASMQPAFGPAWQQQQAFPPPNMIHAQQQGRQTVNFGTDSRFQPSGYAAPNNPMDPDIPQAMKMHPMDWFEPASASTTQPNTRPNTRPNTQPSSPVWQKKRTFDEFQQDHTRNGTIKPTTGTIQPTPPQSDTRRKRSSVTKREPSSQPRTPLSKTKSQTSMTTENARMDDHEEDAEAEEEETRSPSPAPWPANKARPPRKTPPPPKPPRKKKGTPNTSTTVKPKLKHQPSSSGSKVASSRTPLSLEQKKANHTNSEQRRRDATARSYAELYDLVPELEDIGKQSTMKKLEVVVAKVQRVKQTVEDLRLKLGLDPVSGRPMNAGAQGALLHSDVQGWRS
ncbi:hypothetical protein EDD37DRAFT_610373 [Exophiala viscosa]|uniref:BHLH domain-containing protein n=1 Tax=Exophiala viscosa TaxID=2486360 RepID=A0AAN6DSX2_9EURO|nr:hypothetical protein EDD36DRAFT_419943 [Exophiala viscosa]KAI1623058.1 hypothetical protein EDD37DRAFT_610373 [Exophiala viscosa]